MHLARILRVTNIFFTDVFPLFPMVPMALSNAFYNTFVKRNSIYVTGIFAASFAFAVGFDSGVTAFWDHWNHGKQWKDIREKYVSDS